MIVVAFPWRFSWYDDSKVAMGITGLNFGVANKVGRKSWIESLVYKFVGIKAGSNFFGPIGHGLKVMLKLCRVA